ncbi:MAG: DegV family protein [Coriobacteriia bacterium]|nr:DegV family protein [Coriobacteriia bacterium]
MGRVSQAAGGSRIVGVKVIADSTSYIPRPLRASLDIGVATLSSLLDGVTYLDDAEDYSAFYDALAKSGAFPTTSQPAVQDMVDLMEERVAAGHEVVGVFISELMSGTYSTALLARDMVIEKHPDAVIEVVDGRSNCMELGYAVLAAAQKAAGGGTADECVAAAKEMTLHTRFLFTPLTLEYLRRGGRIGNAQSLLATLLQIKPVLTVVDGVTDTFAKIRTLQKAHDLIVDTFAADIRDKGGLGEAFVHHIHDEAAGKTFRDRIAEVAGREIELLDIGPAIGSHVGPGTVAVVYSTNGLMHKAG